MSSGQNLRQVIHAGSPVRVTSLDRITPTSGTSGQSARQVIVAGTPTRTDAPNRIAQSSGTSGQSVRQAIHGGAPIRNPLNQNAKASEFGHRVTQVVDAGEPTRAGQPMSKEE